MKCPICGRELRRSTKDPEYGLCDNCRKRFKIEQYTQADSFNDTGFDLFDKAEKGKEIASSGSEVVLHLKSNGKFEVTVTRNSVSIQQKGALNALNRGFTGEKKFMLKNISGLQYKEAGFTTGYLQLILIGSSESKRGVTGAVKDENTILFAKKEQHLIEELKEYIEYVISTEETGQPSSNNSAADEIRKYKELLDDGIITQEEFDIKKKQLLGL